MRFPFRLVAIDLDETLLDQEHNISPQNEKAVEALVDDRVICTIASGRMHEATTRYASQLGLDTPVISYNGAMIKIPSSSETWRHEKVESNLASEIVNFCAEFNYHLNYYLNDRLLVKERNKWSEIYLSQTGSPIEVYGDLRNLAGSAPTKLLLIDSPESTIRLQSEFKVRFGDKLYITRTNPEYLEFMNPLASKGSSLEIVARTMQIDQKLTLAVGDNMNDISMIKWAGLGAAMGNAKPELKAVSDRVIGNNTESGFANFIFQLFEEN